MRRTVWAKNASIGEKKGLVRHVGRDGGTHERDSSGMGPRWLGAVRLGGFGEANAFFLWHPLRRAAERGTAAAESDLRLQSPPESRERPFPPKRPHSADASSRFAMAAAPEPPQVSDLELAALERNRGTWAPLAQADLDRAAAVGPLWIDLLSGRLLATVCRLSAGDPFATRASLTCDWMLGVHWPELSGGREAASPLRPGGVRRAGFSRVLGAEGDMYKAHASGLYALLHRAHLGRPPARDPFPSEPKAKLKMARRLFTASVYISRTEGGGSEEATAVESPEEEDEEETVEERARKRPRRRDETNRFRPRRRCFPLCLLPLLVAYAPWMRADYRPADTGRTAFEALATQCREAQRVACEAMGTPWPCPPLCDALEYALEAAIEHAVDAPPILLRSLPRPRLPPLQVLDGPPGATADRLKLSVAGPFAREHLMACLGECLSRSCIYADVYCERVEAGVMPDLERVRERCPPLEIAFHIGAADVRNSMPL